MRATVAMTEVREEGGPAPMACSASASAGVEGRARHPQPARDRHVGPGQQLDEPGGSPSAPYQNRASTPWKRPGASPRRRCSGPNSKNA